MTFFRRLRNWRRRARAIRDLRNLPPEIRTDIGIEPGTEAEAVSGLLAREDKPKPRPDLLLYKAAMFQRVNRPVLNRPDC